MIISMYFISFMIFSFMGWIYESIYCTLRTHHWANRGFLFGAICPIYGVGGIISTLVFKIIFNENEVEIWQIFFVCMFGSAVLEYITSYVLEKLFHAMWWDYSYVPLNIHGRVCLPASIGFGIAGIFVVKYISPFVFGVVEKIPPLAMEGTAMIMISFVGADIALTVEGLTQLVKKMEEMEKEFDEKMEASYQIIEEKRQLISEKMEGYEKFTTDRIREYSLNMGLLQQHALKSMKKFSSKGRAQIADKFKDAINSLPVVEKMRKIDDEK
ncbi:MAG: putative ABC transporter permease [Catonella sp.]|uniref:putative ABC transporter permease n=1 Tax=Catonella sp. TaxID=2382125 RepID=UPI003F9F9E71